VDRAYELEVPPEANLREVGGRILADVGLSGAFGASRPNERQINVYRMDFLQPARVTYFLDQKRVLAEEREFHWPQFLTGLHARGGFEQDSMLNDAWGVTVDVICVAMVLWIATGIYMWWQLPACRGWGWLALGGGVGSFVMFLLAL